MKSLLKIATLFSFLILIASCGQKSDIKQGETMKQENPPISERLKQFAPTLIKADVSHLSENDKKVVRILAEAGKLANALYWKQTSPDAIPIRDSLQKLNTEEAKTLLRYVNIQFSPYDRIYGSERFAGVGPQKKPEVANYYPQDMTKAEFENYIKAHPEQKTELESQYTVVVRDGSKLKAIPFHQYYPEVEQIAAKLEEAASFCDNPSLKNYLTLRAKALRTDDYFDSDMAWMDLKDNNIDVVIGPIENYEDELFNYKTAYECVVMIKDFEATKELELYEQNIDNFEHTLPYDKKYIRETAGKGNVLQIVNVAYFGGDCQKAVKTIAASLPNDPKVHELKGGKKSMYKNMMEAKFDQIVVPIAKKILDPALVQHVDKKAFTSFVTLHEVSHTLGRSYVFGNDKLDVRRALKEKYSALEETKADILGMFNHKYLLDMKLITPEYMQKAMATYLAGLYRSIRFGAEAHGQSNLVQLNFLREKGAILKNKDGKFSIDKKIFFEKVGELAKIVLTIEAEGDYNQGVKFLEKYGKMTNEISAVIESLKDIPRDLDTTYEY